MDTKTLIDSVMKKVLSYRRDFHRFPEPGWLEFRTSSRIASILMKLGYDVKLGEEIIKREAVTRGGKPLYYQVITPIAADHHSSRFDFDERGLSLALTLHTEMAKRLLKRAHV